MKIELKELLTAMSQVSSLVAGDKTIPGVMFDIKKDYISICYTDGNKMFCKKLGAEVAEEEAVGRIVFSYQALLNALDGFRPTGNIVIDDVEMTFKSNNIIRLKAEKKLPYTEDDGLGGEVEVMRTMSVVEKSLAWVKADSSLRVAVLNRGNYDSLYHYDSSEAIEGAITTGEWLTARDEWSVEELREILSKLATESGKLVYVAPSSKKAFVQNTSCVISTPVISDIKNKIILPVSLAKALSNVLRDVKEDVIYTHEIANDTMVYSNEDNSFAVSIKNSKQKNSDIVQANNCIGLGYTDYIFTFNREILQNNLAGVKGDGNNSKIEIKFDTSDEIKLVMEVKNSNNSIDNRYDLVADYVLCRDEASLDDISITASIETLYNAVIRADTDYIALDIHLDEDGLNMMRIAGLDLVKRQEINETLGIDSWGDDFMRENRDKMFGYTTYFAVSTE